MLMMNAAYYRYQVNYFVRFDIVLAMNTIDTDKISIDEERSSKSSMGVKNQQTSRRPLMNRGGNDDGINTSGTSLNYHTTIVILLLSLSPL
jgi:hypothetical protein